MAPAPSLAQPVTDVAPSPSPDLPVTPAEELPFSAEAPAAPDLALPPLAVRQYVVIDVARAAAARGTPVSEDVLDDVVPRFVTIAKVQLDPADRRIVETAEVDPVRTDRRPETTQTQATAAAPADGPTATAAAALVVVGLTVQALFQGVMAMYHRIAPTKVLDNGTRRAIHGEVNRRGAATITDVAKAVDVHPKTVRYHLDLLVKFQLLVRDDDGAYRPPGLQREMPAEVEETIVELVEARPGINMAEVARALDMSKSTAQQKVTELLVEGRLESRRESRARRLFPAAA